MKNILLYILLLILPIAVFAADFSLSAGGGGLIGYTFTRYTLEGKNTGGGNVKSAQNMDRFNYGGFLFFDATYAVLSVMYQSGNSEYNENMILSDMSLTDGTGKGFETSINLSLMGKYPFKLNEKLSLFPMLGLEYQIALKQIRAPTGRGGIEYDRTKGSLIEDRDKNNKPYPISAWNALWINIGGGGDFSLTNKLFLRGEFIFGFRLPTDYEMGALEVVKNPPMNVINPRLAGLTGTPAFKLGLGYRF